MPKKTISAPNCPQSALFWFYSPELIFKARSNVDADSESLLYADLRGWSGLLVRTTGSTLKLDLKKKSPKMPLMAHYTGAGFEFQQPPSILRVLLMILSIRPLQPLKSAYIEHSESISTLTVALLVQP